jgi:hypothetical protein
MTPIQKWPAVRAALLVTAMLMWWLPMARSQQEVCPAWFLAGRQSGSAVFAVAGGASQASAQTTREGRYCLPLSKFGAKQAGPSRTRHPGRIALERSSERNRLGATVRT